MDVIQRRKRNLKEKYSFILAKDDFKKFTFENDELDSSDRNSENVKISDQSLQNTRKHLRNCKKENLQTMLRELLHTMRGKNISNYDKTLVKNLEKYKNIIGKPMRLFEMNNEFIFRGKYWFFASNKAIQRSTNKYFVPT